MAVAGGPYSMRRIYLDYNATTPVRPEVVDVMTTCLAENFGNPSSVHWAGRRAKRTLEEARERVAALIGAASAEVLFTSGGTESNNLALLGLLRAQGKRTARVVTTGIEHASVRETLRTLNDEMEEVELVELGVDSAGRVSRSALETTLTPDTALVSIGLANHEIGTLQPIGELSRVVRARGIPLHIDAVQAAGKISVDVNRLGADALSLSAHKIYGPKGIGALYIRKDTVLQPVLRGGPQEREKRPGTENLAAAVGFGLAAELCAHEIETVSAQQIQLIARLWDGIKSRVPEVVRYTPTQACLPNTLSVGFADASGEGLMMGLDLAGVAVSTGSACAAGSIEPSHVLSALGCDAAQAKSAIRFSSGRDTGQTDIDAVIDVLPGVVERVREAGQVA